MRRHPSAGSRVVRGRHLAISRLFGEPVAAKVPEIIFLFWVIKILTTAGGEVTSDYLKTFGNIGGGGIEVGLFVIGLVLQFGTRRYRAVAYWFLAYAIAIFGTGVADFLHLDVGIPYSGTTVLWAVVLAAIFWVWDRNEGTLSIHSITTRRREAYYWATVFATFALGTALGDYTATALSLGYLGSGILFGAVILIPAFAWWKLGLNEVGAFWFAYVVTRPLGASFADYVSKPHSLSGVNFGNGQTAVGLTLIVAVLVLYLAIARPDIQPPLGTSRDGERLEAAVADKTGATGSGLGSQRPTPNRYIGGWSARRGRLLASESLRPVDPRSDHEASAPFIDSAESERVDEDRS
jgi:uncharacterized membrane-anchored protein